MVRLSSSFVALCSPSLASNSRTKNKSQASVGVSVGLFGSIMICEIKSEQIDVLKLQAEVIRLYISYAVQVKLVSCQQCHAQYTEYSKTQCLYHSQLWSQSHHAVQI